MPLVSIGAIAEQAHIATSTIRYYERIGLLPPPQRANGRRRYDSSILKKLRLIRLAQQAGFALEEIQTLMNGFPINTPPAERWQTMSAAKLIELDEMLAHLQATRSMVEKTLQCQCPTLNDCATEKEQASGASEMVASCH
jgi:MerR family redox-sensitive transcriptional activator SoxR